MATGPIDPFSVLIASAATCERSENIIANVIKQLDIAARVGYAKIFEINTAWWHSFWAKPLNYLYVMNWSSRVCGLNKRVKWRHATN